MGVSAANQARMRRIVARMRAAGLSVIEQPGCYERSARTEAFDPRGVVEHHDASGGGEWGLLAYITTGAATAPLAQFQVSRSGAWAVVAAGRANHAGKGGPLPRLGIGIDSGNRYLYGVEVANNGKGETYAPELHRSLDVGFACILDELGAPTSALVGHKEYAPDRKIDPLHSMDWRRARVAAYRAAPMEDEVTPEDRKAIVDDVVAALAPVIAATAAQAATAAMEAAGARGAAERANGVAILGRLAAERAATAASGAATAREVADLAARMPRVNSRRYSRPGVDGYDELALAATSYEELSGALAGVVASVDEGMIREAVADAAPRTGTLVLS